MSSIADKMIRAKIVELERRGSVRRGLYRIKHFPVYLVLSNIFAVNVRN